MKQVIRQIKERSTIVLQSKGIKYHLWRIDDLEYDKLRDNSLPIEDPDFWFYHSLFRSQRGKEDELNLAEFFVVLESIFGESSDCFDRWKGSFSFPLLLVVEKKIGSFFYLMQISDHRGFVYFRLNKIVKNGVEGNENNRVHKPEEQEFSRLEINYFFSYFYGYLIGYFEVFKEITITQPFLNRIDQERQRAEGRRQKGMLASVLCPVPGRNKGLKPHRLHGAHNWLGSESPSNCSFCPLPSASCLLQSNLIFYGYKDNDYFEEDCNTPEEYQAGIQSFEDKYGKGSKPKNVNALLQHIMNESVETT